MNLRAIATLGLTIALYHRNKVQKRGVCYFKLLFIYVNLGVQS